MNRILHAAILIAVLAPCGIHAKEAGAERTKKTKDKGIPHGRYTINEMVNAKTTDEVLKVFTNHDDPPQWKIDLVAKAHDFFSRDENATFEGLINDPAFMKIVKANGMDLLGGPLLGQISATGASVWVRTIGPAEASITLEDRGESRTFGPVKTTAQADFSAVIAVTGLKPDQEYPYTVVIDGKPVEAGGVIKTVDSEEIRIAFGSCPHRWGLGRGPIWDRMLLRGNKALLIYGDIAVQDRMFHFGLHRFDYFMRDQHAAWGKLQANLPVYAAWDDHDFMNNDQPKNGSDIHREGRIGIRKVFKTSWNNPQYGFGDDGGGVFLRTRIGPADVIMTDQRYFRGIEGPLLGAAQMEWLEKQLLDCKGPFIIISSGCMWSDAKGNGKDSWGLYDKEGREKIFQLIEKHKIPGVLLVSGDWHGARVYKIDRPSGYSFYEFEPASLGGRPGASRVENIKDCVFAIAGQYAFGEFTFDTAADDPTVTFRLMHEDGTELYTQTLTRAELTPK